jgi:CheY-like chemotaxis protein
MVQEIRVVLVDDHPIYREGVARTLADAGGIHVVGQATLASLAFTLTAPVSAATKGSTIVAFEEALQGDFDKRKKKRVKGGSGCDDAGDVLEHPECR